MKPAGSGRPICDYEGSNYQQAFWDQGEREYEDRAEAVALARLLPAAGERLLEVGAGAGRNTPRYRGFRQVVLLDYSMTQLQHAQARLGAGGRYLYVAGDAYRLPFQAGAFDAATMIRTIHHLVEPPAALREVFQALAPGGAFILEFANKRNLKAILRWAARRQTWSPFSGESVEFAPLNFDFHPRTMRQWLRTSGFTIVRQLTVSHFRMGVLKRNVPVAVLVALDGLAQWTGGLWQLSPSVFVRADRPGSLAPLGDALWKCPHCGASDLEQVSGGMACRGCGRLWPRVDGIYDFRDTKTSAA